MSPLGTLLRYRRAGPARLAWNLPNLHGPELLTLTSNDFADEHPIPLTHTGARIDGANIVPAKPRGTAVGPVLTSDADESELPSLRMDLLAWLAAEPGSGLHEIAPGWYSTRPAYMNGDGSILSDAPQHCPQPARRPACPPNGRAVLPRLMKDGEGCASTGRRSPRSTSRSRQIAACW